MNKGYFQIISSNEHQLDIYVNLYNEIYPMLYKFVCSIKDSLLTRSLREEIRNTLFGYMFVASLKLERQFAKALLYHMITDIGLLLDSQSIMYYLLEVLQED
mgnify:CR=1 FL=1